ncbi:hypothetical protein DLM45_13240 [Hyphomicrobium methylovorum]|uniref:hypothetical protein n=1 Tax=Hyphomicrobium methylovorum TaxID=84 RepID=UPI0015E6F362|nr:hypothetical protein [Hyphomicrobium methylovorum]MBA2127178.1 hypothetical protein [Hyphomicrobium methylovorum]
MPAELSLTLDRRNLARFRTLLKANRMMAAKSLTFVAEKAKPAWIAGHSLFHRRNTWLDRGVRIRAATPGNLNSQVGSLDKFFARHVKGIDEHKGGRLFVPAYRDISEAPTHTKVRAMLRRAEGTQRKPFRIGDTLVRRKGKTRTPLIVLGRITNGAKIEPRFDALEIVDRAVTENFPTVYSRLLRAWSAKN